MSDCEILRRSICAGDANPAVVSAMKHKTSRENIIRPELQGSANTESTGGLVGTTLYPFSTALGISSTMKQREKVTFELTLPCSMAIACAIRIPDSALTTSRNEASKRGISGHQISSPQSTDNKIKVKSPSLMVIGIGSLASSR